jgi:GNAT superfamily N-acetyltransferase
MRVEDAAEAERLSDESYHALDLATRTVDQPPPSRRTAAHSAAWRARTEHLLATDPGGSWVAERGSEMVGFATSFKRELMWILAAFAVRPGLQGGGVGRALLEPALGYGRGCLRGMFNASSDPRATRRYRAAGFTLHPQMFLRGVVDRSLLPIVEHVREGSASDVDLMDSIDHVTTANEWAVDVGMAARLELHQRGYLAVRHLNPPAPYLPHGALL